MKRIKNIRNIILCALFLFVLCLFCGCGATVDTDMTIDAGFSGKRTISLTIGSDDLSEYVTGGIAGLETVIKGNLPSQMTYDISTAESGDSIINFHINFSSQEDYKTKVTAILTAGGVEEIPEIVYDKQDNPFKKGIVYSENFDSIDLLEWYKKALQTAGIISETSTSDWYERGTGKVTIEGAEFSSSYAFDIDEMVDNSLDDLDVYTTVSLNGSIVRKVEFLVEDRTYTTLKDGGCNLDIYFKELISDNDTLVHERLDNYYQDHKFIVTLNAANVSELAEKTNKLLCTDGNTFEWTVVAKEDTPGYAIISVKETLDTSYYVDAYSSSSTVQIFENAVLNNDNLQSSESGFRYAPMGEVVEATLTWKIGFERIEFDIKPYGKENLNVKIKFSVNPVFDEALRTSAFSSVETYAEKFDVEKEENALTVSVKGSANEVASALNQLAKGPSAEERDFVTIEITEASTKSPFTTGKKVVMNYDFSELIGENSQIILVNSDNIYLSDVIENEDETVSIDSVDELSLYKQSVEIFPIILVAVFVLLIVGAVVLGFIAREELLATISFVKNIKFHKPVRQTNPTISSIENPVSAPAPVSTEEEQEEEEVLL